MECRFKKNSAQVWLTGCFMIACLGFLSANGGAQVSSLSQGNPYKVLDSAARDARQNDDASVRTLTEAVFAFPRMLSRMPDVIEKSVQDRLVNAELAYRHGSQKGVREEDLVKLVNSMADKLHAPGYAKTSLKQIRVLRMQLVLASPVFMAQGLTTQHMQVGSSVNSEMSPLQAVHLLNSLIDQKLINPAFQMEPAEWERSQASVEMDRIRAAQDRLQSHKGPGGPPRAAIKLHKRNRDLQVALSQASSNLSFLDAMNLVDDAFTTLKLNQ